MRPIAVVAAALGLFSGCSRAESPALQPPASASAGAAASAPPAAPSSAAPRGTWSGTYVSAAAGLYIPDGGEWAQTKWRGDESPDGLGAGTLTLSVDATTGRVSGTIDGPLGPAIVSGALAGSALTAQVARKEAADGAFTGTLVGTVSLGKAAGVMRLSRGDARVIREASFSIENK